MSSRGQNGECKRSNGGGKSSTDHISPLDHGCFLVTHATDAKRFSLAQGEISALLPLIQPVLAQKPGAIGTSDLGLPFFEAVCRRNDP
jgi:hypothetical protein